MLNKEDSNWRDAWNGAPIYADEFIYLATVSDHIKVGSAMNPSARVKVLSMQHKSKFDCIGTFPGSMIIEKRLHSLLGIYRIDRGLEYFRLPMELCHEIIAYGRLQAISAMESGSMQLGPATIKALDASLNGERRSRTPSDSYEFPFSGTILISDAHGVLARNPELGKARQS